MPDRHRPFAAIFLLLCRSLFLPCLLLLGGCGPKEEPGRGPAKPSGPARGITRIAILADDAVNPMRNYQTTLLERLLRTRPRTEISTVHAGGDAGVQARQVREAVAAGASFLMVFPQDAVKLAPVLRDEAVARGVKVFAFSAAIPDDACTCSISTDERTLGRIAGEHVITALKMKASAEGLPAPAGRVVMLRGDEGSAACQSRAEGFLSVLQPFPGIILVHDAPADWNEKDAADRVREALRIQKQFDVLYAQNDFIAAGAAKAVREASAAARESMLIIGTDGVPGRGTGVFMVLNGDLDATVYHPPLVDAAWREMQPLFDKPDAAVRKRLRVKPFIITAENAAAIQQRGLPAPDIE